MRKQSFWIPICIGLAASFLFAACNSNKTKEATVVTSEDGKTKVTINPDGVTNLNDASEAMAKKTEELKKLTPLSMDELKAMVPEEFMGMKRTSFNANSMMGTGMVNASYKSEDGKELKVNVIDCAGEAGAGYYTLNFWSLWNFEQQDDNGYQKTVDFNGQKAVEKYSKYNDEYSITFPAKERLLVVVEGEKMGLDAVKQAAQSLKF
jgi:hypothetical protein